MDTEANVDDLVDLWELMRDRGTHPTVEELCAGRLELAGELRRRIEVLEAMELALDTEAPEPTARRERRSAVPDGGRAEVLRATAVYRARGHHAQGGLGVVSTAYQDELDRTVALKRIRPDRLREVARRRFLREAVLTARLQHPGIVPIYGLGEDEAGPFYTMPFIEGQTLQEAINEFHGVQPAHQDPGEHGLRLRGLLQHFIAVCNTVAYAHDQGVVHRDLKPSNLMLGPYGETLVLDWGLAKRFGEGEAAGEGEVDPPSPSPSAEDVTRTGEVLGTPNYMSPEQARGEPARPAGDGFSLGLVLYAILTGKSAFDESSQRGPDRLKAVRDAAIVPPRRRDPGVPRPLEAICRKALAAHARDRYSSASALANDVVKWLADEPVTSYAEPIAQRARRWLRRRRTLVTSAAAVLISGVVGLASFAMVLAGKNAELAKRGVALDLKNSQLLGKNSELDRERERALERQQLAIAAVKKFRDAVTANDGLKNQPELGPLRQTLLKEPLEFFRTLRDQLQADSDARPDALAKLADANMELADVTRQIGSVPDAIRSYSESRNLRERLVREHPNIVKYQRDLAASHNDLANLLRDTGRLTEALESYGRAVEILERLVGDSADVTRFQRELATCYSNIGLLLGSTGRFAEGMKSERRALEIRERLARDHPAVAELQNDLATSQFGIANLLYATGHPAEAIDAMREALAIRQRLARDHANVPAYQNDLADSQHNVGHLLSTTGHPAEALERYRNALLIGAELIRNNPSITKYQSDQAIRYNDNGALLGELGQLPEALDSFRQALEVQERLVRDHPSIHFYQSGLGITLQNIAETEMLGGRWREALAHLERAIKYERAALAAMPGDQICQKGLKYQLLNLAKVYAALNQPAEMIRTAHELGALAQNFPPALYDAASALALCVPLTRGEQQRRLAAEAVQVLKRAIAAGWRDAAKINREPDLAPLRGRDDFRRLVAELFDRRFPADPFAL
jgi:serine/threonine protein kinase